MCKEIKDSKKIEESKRARIVFFVCVMVVMFIMFFLGRRQIHRTIILEEDKFNWVFQVDTIEIKGNDLLLAGWAFELEKDTTGKDYEIVLYDIDTNKFFYPKMNYTIREDVNNYFLCEYDYSLSGFEANISVEKLDLDNGIYQVLIQSRKKRIAIETNIYYADGKMMFTNPREYVGLTVKGTDIENVVEKGVLRVYRPDYGMYVYQYEGELYWIAELDYGFVNENSLVQFHLYTTQIQKLPEDRLANNWLWSNISFRFKSKELVDWNTGKYRVTRCALPIEYSITKITTGNYRNGDWIWKQYFRPWYDLSE